MEEYINTLPQNLKYIAEKSVVLQIFKRLLLLLVFIKSIYNTMPFKDKLIKELQKCINQFPAPTQTQLHLVPVREDQKNKIHKKKMKKITPKINNIYEMFLSKAPATCSHVINFCNLLGINQDAVRSQDFEQSYCRTAFYLQNIRKAEIKQYYIVFHLKPSNYSFAPMYLKKDVREYSIERFKSFGDIKFFNMAQTMEQLNLRMIELKNHVGKPVKQDNNDLFEKYLDSLGNKMFVVKNLNKMVISKSFLQLLEFNPEEFTLEAIKFKCSIYEGCSAQNYYNVILKSLENVKNLIDLLFDRISLEVFLDNSIMRFRDFLYTKNHKKVFTKLKVGMPNPFLTIFQVEQVINISEDLSVKSYYTGIKKQQLQEIKQQCNRADIKTMRNLLKLPPNHLPENKHKVTNYTQKKSHLKQEQN